MRLNPVVRDALAYAVHTLNEDGKPAACIINEGVFVPLETFARHGVQPSLAIRALAETNLLAKPGYDGPPTRSYQFNGLPTVGIVLDPRCVSGFDPAGFTPQSAPEG